MFCLKNDKHVIKFHFLVAKNVRKVIIFGIIKASNRLVFIVSLGDGQTFLCSEAFVHAGVGKKNAGAEFVTRKCKVGLGVRIIILAQI